MDIMKYPRLRIKTLFMYFNWFTSSFILYGIALNWQALTGGLFLNFAIAAALDFPAKLLALVSLVWLGRRLPYISLTFLAGFCFIISLFIERWELLLSRGMFDCVTQGCLQGRTPHSCPQHDQQFLCLGLVCDVVDVDLRTDADLSQERGGRILQLRSQNRRGENFEIYDHFDPRDRLQIVSTTVTTMAEVSPQLPTLLFALVAVISASVSLFLPETHGAALPDTVEESEEVELVGVREVCKCGHQADTQSQ